MTTPMDPVTFDICWNRLVGVVNEQAAALQRTSFTSIVREAGDLSAGVFDRRGWMTAEEDLWYVPEHLVDIPHHRLLTPAEERRLAPVSRVMFHGGLVGREES